MTPDERFMRRCFDLAAKGMGHVSPNPLVGCVIVHEGQIIGEGWHQKYGGPHAEVNAVAAVTDQTLLPHSTVYVNLEPCSHFGKTPPCADMLVSHRVKRVVISNIDSNQLVGGKGIAKLKAAGIDVTIGVLEKEGRRLNRRFFTFMEQHRPYIILKWAQTSDGFIAPTEGQLQITNSLSKKLLHRWRSEEDAFLVGRRTAAIDNPKLNVREWTGRDPIRIVLDRKLSLPSNLHLFDGSQKTWIYNTVRDQSTGSGEWIKLNESTFILDAITDLFKRRILSVVIEGGAETLQLFLANNLWDEARVFRASTTLGNGIVAPEIESKPTSSEDVGGDLLQVYQNLSANPLPVN